jgi:hypothetical protein
LFLPLFFVFAVAFLVVIPAGNLLWLCTSAIAFGISPGSRVLQNDFALKGRGFSNAISSIQATQL